MKTVYNILSVILFPIAFVTLFFVIGGSKHGATCWIGFGFTLFAYLLISLLPVLAPKTRSAHIFRTTSTVINIIFIGINFIIGLLFMIEDFDEWKYPLLVEIILFVLFFVYLFQVLRINEITAIKEIKQDQEFCAVKELVNKSKIIMDSTNDMQMKKIVQLVYNELNTCQINNNGNVKDLDDAISTIVLIKKRKDKSRH